MSVVIDGSSGITTNSGTVVSTTDATLNGLTAGKGGGSVSTNTAVGASALNATNTGGKCTAFGYQALTLTTGKENTAVGSGAGASMTSGEGLAAFGWNAANLNTADNVTALGHNTLGSNTTGTNNTAVGNAALNVNTTGSSNTAVGRQALVSNTTASNNTAVGYQAGYSISTNTGGTFVGWTAGKNATGNYNTIIGNNAVGGAGGAGTDNTIVGYSAGNGITTGSGNTIVGDNAGTFISTGSSNTFIGGGIVGSTGGAGFYVTTGTGNTILGNYNGNAGSLDIRTANGYVVLSDGYGNWKAYFNGAAGGWYQTNNSSSWATTSDQRIKENITDVENGLAKIIALCPVEFDYKIGQKNHDAGFIAQQYESVFPEQIVEQHSVGEELSALTGGEPVKGIQQNLVPYLVSAIKELKALVDAQATLISGQAAEIAELKAKVG